MFFARVADNAAEASLASYKQVNTTNHQDQDPSTMSDTTFLGKVNQNAVVIGRGRRIKEVRTLYRRCDTLL